MNLDHHLNRMSTMPLTVLAIDPGNTESAYVLTGPGCRPVEFGKVDNRDLRSVLRYGRLAVNADIVAIEMVASYGMPVGAEVFETCVWIGRLYEAIHVRLGTTEPLLVYRRDVKLHHCHSAKATDATVRQALVDRFATDVRNHGKGTKAAPGWFYGFKADVWQAYALAVYVADTTPIAPAPISVPAAATPCAAAGTDTTPGAPDAWGSAQEHRDTEAGAGALF